VVIAQRNALETVPISIDGQPILARASETVLEAARREGIYIPTLCYSPHLKPFGACRLCIVEIEGIRGLPAACTTPVAAGMTVRTDSELLSRVRRQTLELMISDHPLDCLTCRQNGRCELQKVAAYLGALGQEFEPLGKSLPVDDSNPFFQRDMGKCILCGRCVRVCDEVVNVHAIDFINRGYNAKIGTLFDRPVATSRCVSCGECVSECPTGALTEKQHHGLPSREVRTVCGYCGVGCGIYLQVKAGQVIGVRGDPEAAANEGHLCVKGRFGYEFIHHRDRLQTPMVRQEGMLQPVSWEEALDVVAENLALARGKFGALSSAKCTNEENYLFQKFVRGVMGTNNVDHCARR